MPKPNEQVLVFPADLLDKLGYFEGLYKGIGLTEYVNRILSSKQLHYMDREIAEHDPNFKQLIPYQVLTAEGKVFTYQRTKKGNDPRLHDLHSLGVGGHINPADADGHTENVYEVAKHRELVEEVGELPLHGTEVVGLLYDPSTPIGQVHFGVIHRLMFSVIPQIHSQDAALTAGDFRDTVWIKDNIDKFETWSQLVIKELL